MQRGSACELDDAPISIFLYEMSPAISEAFLSQIVFRGLNAECQLSVSNVQFSSVQLKARLTNWRASHVSHRPRAASLTTFVMSLAAASEARKARLLALRKKRAGEDVEDVRYVTPDFQRNSC